MATEGEHEQTDVDQPEAARAQAPEDPVAQIERERDEMKAIAQRAQADLVNYKRRAEEERWALARSASNSVVGKLLPIADDLQRAVDALPDDAPESWSSGLHLVAQNMRSLLESEGVTRFEPAPGDPFDPAEQEAIASQPSAEHPSGAVLMTISAGYRGRDRVLRAAQVVVSQGAIEGDKARND
jgi:molecular chaperone GrpE